MVITTTKKEFGYSGRSEKSQKGSSLPSAGFFTSFRMTEKFVEKFNSYLNLCEMGYLMGNLAHYY
jgi:hypothetical protein